MTHSIGFYRLGAFAAHAFMLCTLAFSLLVVTPETGNAGPIHICEVKGVEFQVIGTPGPGVPRRTIEDIMSVMAANDIDELIINGSSQRGMRVRLNDDLVPSIVMRQGQPVRWSRGPNGSDLDFGFSSMDDATRMMNAEAELQGVRHSGQGIRHAPMTFYDPSEVSRNVSNVLGPPMRGADAPEALLIRNANSSGGIGPTLLKHLGDVKPSHGIPTGSRFGILQDFTEELGNTRAAQFIKSSGPNIVKGCGAGSPAIPLQPKFEDTFKSTLGLNSADAGVLADGATATVGGGFAYAAMRARPVATSAGGASAAGLAAGVGVHTSIMLNITDSYTSSMQNATAAGDYQAAADAANEYLELSSYGGLGAIGYGIRTYAEAAVTGPVSPSAPHAALINVANEWRLQIMDIFR